MTPEDFLKGMTLLSVAYPKFETDENTVRVWYSFFEDIRAETFIAAVKNQIRNSPFPPKINELLERCEEFKGITQNDTLKYMYDIGYFHTPNLSDVHALRNYQKALSWVERNTEPEWLKNDMRKHYSMKLDQPNQQLKIGVQK